MLKTSGLWLTLSAGSEPGRPALFHFLIDDALDSCSPAITVAVLSDSAALDGPGNRKRPIASAIRCLGSAPQLP